MDTIYVKNKIKRLLVMKGVSDQKVSIELGMNKTYIQKIITGRIVPTLEELFCICKYFEISVSEFFQEEQNSYSQIKKLYDYVCQLPSEELQAVIDYAEKMRNNTIH